jgi:hypothetical protein
MFINDNNNVFIFQLKFYNTDNDIIKIKEVGHF